MNETIFQETDAAASIKEIRRRDPYDHVFFDFCFGIMFGFYVPEFNNLFICMS